MKKPALTIGELELITMLQDPKAVVIDSRTRDWFEGGTIPGAINPKDSRYERGTTGGQVTGTARQQNLSRCFAMASGAASRPRSTP